MTDPNEPLVVKETLNNIFVGVCSLFISFLSGILQRNEISEASSWSQPPEFTGYGHRSLFIPLLSGLVTFLTAQPVTMVRELFVYPVA